jgi:hypothetical protein
MRTKMITAAFGLMAAILLAAPATATAASATAGTAIHAVADGGDGLTGMHYHG